MKAIVTGAAGFVGSTLARRLLNLGHEVVGVDALTDYYTPSLKVSNLARLKDAKFTSISGDLNDLPLKHLIDGADWVFHQAGQPGVRKSWGEDFGVYSKANIDATQRLLEASRQSSTLKKFVYASSSSVYGDAERYPTLETDRPQPRSPYGVTKLAAENLCTLYASNFGVPTVSLRYFTVYGPRQRPDMAFTRFVRAAVLEEPINIFGSGEQVRDFTFIGDIVEANIAAAIEETEPGEIFNVAGGTSISVNGVLTLLEALNGRPLDVRYGEKVAGDVLQTGGSTSRIFEMLGWRAQTALEDGLAMQLAWARDTFGRRGDSNA
ncbi:NAD-dependent epimerase/dehydratase family protein [Microbacterium gubbeenense]|uniref:NAD-dependent epimerase/dehydratase family protein n=1 Tax=Microbacterium gubbeenense TaxID=159896 RepID=UPI00056015D9|nr:NAD-dependent epimerase/dehydratase family protein [Microbacterium gubbeenense]